MSKKKKQKGTDKKKKNLKKIYKTVKESFKEAPLFHTSELPKSSKFYRTPELSKHLLHSIAEGVRIIKTLIKKDKKMLNEWKEEYYQALFSEFKDFVRKFNAGFELNVEKLKSEIQSKETEKRILIEEIDELKKEKKRLKNA